MITMKKTLTALLAVIMTISIPLSLSGCVKDRSVAAAFILGVRSGFPGIASNADALFDSAYDVCLQEGDVTYAVVEGEPCQAKTVSTKLGDKHLDARKKKQFATHNAEAILKQFLTLAAKTPEADTLSTIRVGADALRASGAENRTLYIYDSGLCTKGLLSQLSKDVLSTDAAILVDKLRELHALPSLENVTVRWIGLGCVSGSQEKIPDSYQFKLKTMWSAILEGAGATVVFDESPVTGEEAEGLPPVTPVPFPQDVLDLQDVDFDNGPLRFPETTLKFLANRAAFAAPDEAADVLKPVLDYLVRYPSEKILIAGMTAKFGGDGKSLSLERAMCVEKILLAGGAAPGQIECVGLGCSENRFRVEDHNADGSLNEEMAALNRTIYILSADSPEAAELREVGR